MVDNFYTDLEKAQEIEKAVAARLEELTDNYSFYWIGDQKEYYHKGDIVAVDKATGEKIFIEVKGDTRIGETGNVLLEDEVYYKQNNNQVPGNLHSDYQIYCVVSEDTQQMWFMDFEKLKGLAERFGEYKVIRHPQQITFALLVPLHRIKQFGALVAKVKIF